MIHSQSQQTQRSKYYVMAFRLATLVGMLICGSYAHAQVPAGYAKLNTALVTTTSYTDSACPATDGITCSYVVTAVDAQGFESAPSNVGNAFVPPTGTHTTSLSWTEASTVSGYNIYMHAGPKAPVLNTPVEN